MENTNEIRKKMVECIEAPFFERKNFRCPSIKKMAEYIRKVHPNWIVNIRSTSCEKRTSCNGMRYSTGGGTREYSGSIITVIVDGKEIINHNTTETYRENREVAKKIIRGEEK